MDQLNRGVEVEGLMLPPGITLTRVDPNTAESLRAKKESIGRVSEAHSSYLSQRFNEIHDLARTTIHPTNVSAN